MLMGDVASLKRVLLKYLDGEVWGVGAAREQAWLCWRKIA